MNKNRVKPNIVDLLIILVVIAVIIFLGFKFYQKNKIEGNTVKIRYTVELTGYDLTFFNSIKIGDIVNISIREKATGSIVAVTEPVLQEFNAYHADTGTYSVQTIPGGDTYKMILTIESEAVDYEYCYKVAGTEIRVGAFVYVQGTGYTGKGYIITTDIVN